MNTVSAVEVHGNKNNRSETISLAKWDAFIILSLSKPNNCANIQKQFMKKKDDYTISIKQYMPK